MLTSSVRGVLEELKSLIFQMDKSEFTHIHSDLNISSVGAHSRHVIELFQCLLKGYQDGVVNYDARIRNPKIETEPLYAIECIIEVLDNLAKPDKPMDVEYVLEGKTSKIHSFYQRELLYNMEHCIHHQALIKVAISKWSDIQVSETFGVAPATIRYRLECAQ